MINGWFIPRADAGAGAEYDCAAVAAYCTVCCVEKQAA